MNTNKIISIALIAMIFGSCSKEAVQESPAVEARNVLVAELSQPVFEEGTKTSLDDGLDVVWSDNDAIAVFANNATDFKKYVSDNTGTGTTIGKFAGDAVDAAYAYYPYKGVMSIDGSNNISVVIPRVQTYSPDSFGQYDMPMLAAGSAGGFCFTNLMAVLKLQMSGTGIIDKIIVMSDTQKMSGMATVAPDGSITFSSVNGESYNWVELECGADGVDLATNPTFHISVPCGSYAFTVRVLSKSGTMAPDKSVTSAKTFAANKIKSMPSYSVTFGSELKYVDGTYVGDPLTITLGGVEYTWAPVNCGYDGSYQDGRYGKLYQAGRKYGQRTNVTISPSAEDRIADDGSDPFNEFKYYSSKQAYTSNTSWYYPLPLWGGDTQKKYDPCPAGWRVPTQAEMNKLFGFENTGDCHHKDRTTMWDVYDGLNGLWFDGGATMNPTSGIFLQAARLRTKTTGKANSGLMYAVQNTSTQHILVNANMKYDSVAKTYSSSMSSVTQAAASGAAIRCIKE